MEEFKDIKGYEGKYKISKSGIVKSTNYNNTLKEKELKPKVNKNGYLEIKLSLHNKTKDYQLSRLVAETFTDIDFNKNIIIMYKDEDKTNCSLDNLFYVSRGDYQAFTYEKGKRKRIYTDYYGKKITVKQLANITNKSEKLIRSRLRSGWNSYECEIPKGERK